MFSLHSGYAKVSGAKDDRVSRYSLEDLLMLMSRLRDPSDGCPWDRAQNFSSIVPFTLEESYELADAIESGDMQQVREEVGDVLFQVIFYSQLGKEAGLFAFGDVVDSIVSKLLRRHPHVFPDGSLQSRSGVQQIDTAEVKQNWEQIKAGERREKERAGVLDDVPVALPALTRAFKLQKRAAQTGFDWDHPEQVIEHLVSELDELTEAKQSCSEEKIVEEFGDLLFCLVNLARHWKIDPEKSLREANRKFEARFRYIEQRLGADGIKPEEATLARMDQLWDEAKSEGL